MSALGQKLPRDLTRGAAAIPLKADTGRRVYESMPSAAGLALCSVSLRRPKRNGDDVSPFRCKATFGGLWFCGCEPLNIQTACADPADTWRAKRTRRQDQHELRSTVTA
jgi:hypothetical protein